MRLLLQVMFGQGYMWRDMHPESPLRPPPEVRSVDRLSLAWAGLFLALGIVDAIVGLRPMTVVFLVTGAAFLAETMPSARFTERVGTDAFWLSVAWGGASVALVGVLINIIAAALTGAWFWMAVMLGFMAFCAAGTVNELQRRYLFFSDPRDFDRQVQSEPGGLLSFWVETYFRLPVRVLGAIVRHPWATAANLSSPGLAETEE